MFVYSKNYEKMKNDLFKEKIHYLLTSSIENSDFYDIDCDIVERAYPLYKGK
jgi:hypothetical protein